MARVTGGSLEFRWPLWLVLLRQNARRITSSRLGGLRTTTYIRKWLILGLLIGSIAGLGALVFYAALENSAHYLLGSIGGYHPAQPVGEGGTGATAHFDRPWAVPLVVGLGGLISGILVWRIAPEAEGHGTDAAIDAVHTNPKGMRPRVSAVKIVSSAITIGSGGSGGREGPTAQISASFASMLARALNLTPADARIAVSSGIASGIAAIFRAPLGGAILGAELLYRNDVEVEALVPSLIASVVSFAIFGAVHGFEPIFGYHNEYQFADPAQLGWFAVLGVMAGVIGRLYVRSFYATVAASKRSRIHPALRPGVGGLLVGLLGLAVPGVLGTGYGEIQNEMSGANLLSMSLWIVVAIPIAKIVATSLSIGSGGSGGIFGPGMVIGGAAGAMLWRVLDGGVIGVPQTPVPFVIVGMMACFGSIAHAPLSVMIMVAEMTGNLAMLAPGMVAIALAVLVVGETSIYRSQLRSRADSPAHRFQFGLPLSASVPLRDVMAPPQLVLPAATPAAEALAVLEAQRLPGAPVVNGREEFIGSIQLPYLQRKVAAGTNETVGRLADAEAMTVPSDAALDAAIEALATSKGAWVPVLDSQMHVLGIIGTTDLIRGYRMSLRMAIRRLGRAARGTALVEETVAPDSPLIGVRVSTVELPHASVVVAISRRNSLLFADAETELQAGDVVSVLARAGNEAELRLAFNPPPAPPTAPVQAAPPGAEELAGPAESGAPAEAAEPAKAAETAEGAEPAEAAEPAGSATVGSATGRDYPTGDEPMAHPTK